MDPKIIESGVAKLMNAEQKMAAIKQKKTELKRRNMELIRDNEEANKKIIALKCASSESQRALVDKKLSEHISMCLACIPQGLHLQKLTRMIERIKPQMVSFLLKNTSPESLEAVSQAIVVQSLERLCSVDIDAQKVMIDIQLPTEHLCKAHLCGCMLAPRKMSKEQFQRKIETQTAIEQEKKRIKNMKKRAAARDRHKNVKNIFEERINKLSKCCMSLERDIMGLNVENKGVTAKLAEIRSFAQDLLIKLRNGKISWEDVEIRMDKMAKSFEVLGKEVKRLMVLQSLPPPVPQTPSNIDNLLAKQQMQRKDGKVLCTRFEISKLIPSLKCDCKNKERCKPYLHERQLGDSIHHTFVTKTNTNKNSRLVKIMESLEMILRDKEHYTFQFDINKYFYDIEIVWIQNNIIYLVQSDIYFEGTHKYLFNKRWIKITI